MGQDETGTVARIKACVELIDPKIAGHRGRIFRRTGDGILGELSEPR